MPAVSKTRLFGLWARARATKIACRSRKDVREDFTLDVELGVKLNFFTRGLLTYYSPQQYADLLGRIKQFKAAGNDFSEMLVDPYYRLPTIRFNDERITDDFLSDQVESNILNLRNFETKLFRYNPRKKEVSGVAVAASSSGLAMNGIHMRILLDVIADARDVFQALSADPTAVLDDVFNTIDKVKARLGFLNVAIYRSLTDENPLAATLKSAASGTRAIYDVDVTNLSTFEREELTYDPAEIGSFLVSTKGPGRMLFIKLTSEAVVLIHSRVRGDNKTIPPPLLPANESDAKRIKTQLELFFGEAVKAIEAIRGREEVPQAVAPVIHIPDASRLLTEDLLFNPDSGVPYPRNPREYHAMMAKLLDEKGRFTEDSKGLTESGTFSPRMRGVRHLFLKRKGKIFQVEVFSPRLHAPESENRQIFDADLTSQIASFDAYRVRGVSYDRESYYGKRFRNAQKVPFIRLEGWPISFAAMQGYEMSFEDRSLPYGFIHFVMTVGAYSGYGLTSYSVREGMSSIFYANAWHNHPALIYDSEGDLQSRRLLLWSAAHAGRFTPFYSFVKGFRATDPSSAPIAEAIFGDIHKRITPPADLDAGEHPNFMFKRINGVSYPVARDVGVYPPHNRYAVEDGRVIFPQSERNLPSHIREAWLEAIGGEEGVAAGNGLYFAGWGGFGEIRAAKRREKEREGGGLEGVGDRLRSWGVKHTR